MNHNVFFPLSFQTTFWHLKKNTHTFSSFLSVLISQQRTKTKNHNKEVVWAPKQTDCGDGDLGWRRRRTIEVLLHGGMSKGLWFFHCKIKRESYYWGCFSEWGACPLLIEDSWFLWKQKKWVESIVSWYAFIVERGSRYNYFSDFLD